MSKFPVKKPSPTDLPVTVQRLIQSSLSESTKARYGSALRYLHVWLNGRELTDVFLSEYLAFCHGKGMAPSTMNVTVSAVRLSARLSGAPPPSYPLTERTLAGIRREGKHRGSGQVTGLTFHEVQFLVSQISKQGVRGVRDAALFSLMSDCLLRVGELVKVRPRDITPIPDGSGRLQIHQSKSDQEGRGATLYVGAPTMEYIRDWMTLIETQFGTIDEQVELFRSLRRGGVIQSRPITPPGVRKNLKAYAKEAGFQGRFSGHSFRVGTAQSLAQKGATLAQMQTVGRWKSPQMPAVYCRNELAGRSAVATLLYNEPPRKANTESEVQERSSP